MLLALSFVSLVSYALAAISGTANVTTPNMANGYIAATVEIDDGKYLIVEYSLPSSESFREIYDFTETNKYLYSEGGFCNPRCGQAKIDYAMPTFAATKASPYTSSSVTVNGVSCTRYTAPNSDYLFSHISYNGDGGICDMLLNNNKHFTFVTYNGNVNLPALTVPDECGCTGGRLDIVFVLDRSGSIARDYTSNNCGGRRGPCEQEWPKVVEFVQEFVTRLTFQEDIPTGGEGEGAYVGFSHFSDRFWTTLPISEGYQRSLVQGSYGATFNCEGQDLGISAPYCKGVADEDDACCGGYTCISCGIAKGVENLDTSARDDAEKVLLVLTDGQPNRLINGDECSTDECRDEIEEQRALALQKYPGLKIVAVGIGTGINRDTLTSVASHDDYIYMVTNFADLLEEIEDLIAIACPSNAFPCGEDDCSFCACGVRQQPSCSGATSCTEVVEQNKCCKKTVIPDSQICPDKYCSYGACVEDQGGCVYTPIETSPCSIDTPCRTYTCDLDLDECTVEYVTDCCESDSECLGNSQCLEYTCEENKCVSTPITCEPVDKCETAICIPNQGCIKTPVACPANTNCTIYTGCNATTAKCNFVLEDTVECVGECKIDSDCDDFNPCTVDSCVDNFCNYTDTICDSDDVCNPRICSPESGCIDKPVTCRVGDNCTTYACEDVDGVGTCVSTRIPACDVPVAECVVDTDCQSANKCRVPRCEDSKCFFDPKDCGVNKCGDTTCDATTGECSVNLYPAAYCDDLNVCTNDTCVPELGCVHVNVTCIPKNNCTIGVCDTVTGCKSAPLLCADPDASPECIMNGTNCPVDNCRIILCENGACAVRMVNCIGGAIGGAIAGTVLSIGAIIGIIVALVVFFGAAGGGAYAASNAIGSGGQSTTTTNPFYKPDGTDVVNPTVG